MFFLFKQKTAYEMRISDWSSDVCSSDLLPDFGWETIRPRWPLPIGAIRSRMRPVMSSLEPLPRSSLNALRGNSGVRFSNCILFLEASGGRSEEHTSEPQSLMRLSYAAFCLKKKK